jgi:molecular chaperone DnaK
LKTLVEEKVVNVRQVLDSEDLDAIRQATEELTQVVQQIGTAAYQQSGPEAGPGGAPEGEPGADGPDEGPANDDDEDVVDGEFRSS